MPGPRYDKEKVARFRKAGRDALKAGKDLKDIPDEPIEILFFDTLEEVERRGGLGGRAPGMLRSLRRRMQME